jgi:RNA polymerase sigma-70 factor (ECF subfamily)
VALAKLAPKDREALTLIAWDGLQPNEAALVLGEAPGTFRVRLHRARRRLRRLLEERPEPVQPASEPRLRVEETTHD